MAVAVLALSSDGEGRVGAIDLPILADARGGGRKRGEDQDRDSGQRCFPSQ
jgi:hypothetical protein